MSHGGGGLSSISEPDERRRHAPGISGRPDGLAAWRLQRDLAIAACTGFLTVSVPHLQFHVTHLGGFGELDAIAELTALAFLLVPPSVALWASAIEEIF